jgi:hypothetical protein
VTKQGINGPIFALIALDSGDYGSEADRAYYRAWIVSHQLVGGGWSLEDEATPDITAMALQALAPYYGKGDVDLDAAVEAGLLTLSALQQPDGGFAWDVSNVESSAQVIVALNALDIPLDDVRFVKDGNTVWDAFISFQLADGSFEHEAGGGTNGMATEQAAYTLASLYRSLTGANSLYDMSDVTLVKWSADDGNNNGNNGGTTNNNTTNNTTNNITNNNGGTGRPVSNYYYYGNSGAGASADSSSSNTDATATQSQSEGSAQTDNRTADATGGSATTSVEDTSTPLAASPGAVIAVDSDALLSGGVFISTRALVGIIFGLAALALIALLIVRLTARKKDVFHD